MENFIDTTKEDYDFVQEVIEDLKLKYTDLSAGHINIPYKDYFLVKEYIGIKNLETVLIKKAQAEVFVSFIQAEYAVPPRRDGSGSATAILALVAVKLPKNFGHIFIKEETIIDKIREVFQPLELDFKEDKPFSRKFYVLAKEPEKAAGFFNTQLREFLLSANVKGVSIEINDELLLLANMKNVWDESLEALINTGLDLSAIRYS